MAKKKTKTKTKTKKGTEKSAAHKRGEALRKKLFGASGAPANPLAADMMDITNESLFGGIWSRPGLELSERSMITVAALVVLGRETQLAVHLGGALNVGISKEKLAEMMVHLAHYGGWPAGMTGLRVLNEVVEAREAT